MMAAPGPDSGIYTRLNTEEEEDDEVVIPLPTLRRYQPLAKTESKGGCCPVFCAIFSLIAIVFLSVIAILLSYESLYFEVSKEYSDRKAELVPSVMGAILMYGVCFLFSMIAWCRGGSYAYRREHTTIDFLDD